MAVTVRMRLTRKRSPPMEDIAILIVPKVLQLIGKAMLIRGQSLGGKTYMSPLNHCSHLL